MTMMLVARALERIGDNAVDIGEQVAFVVTGLFREFSDASHVLRRCVAPDSGESPNCGDRIVNGGVTIVLPVTVTARVAVECSDVCWSTSDAPTTATSRPSASR